MIHKFLALVAAAATLAVASVAMTSSAEARSHHGISRHLDAYAFAPWLRDRYVAPHRYYDRLGSNLNPDRQMVGQGD